MAEFNQIVITNAGLDLFTNIIANKDTLQFTKAITSTNIYPKSQISDLIELTNTKQEVLISDITKEANNQVNAQIVISNETLTESYTINTIRSICKGNKYR